MALYGLSVFLETTKPERKGRIFYIVVSFAITALSAVCAALDAARIFCDLLEAQSGMGYFLIRLRGLEARHALVFLSNCSLRFLILIGDALMVSP